MAKLSDDLEIKLIFSPEGKVVSSKKRCLVPDVGLCLDKDVARTLRPARRGHCPLDILIKSRKGSRTFLADVLVHTSYTGSGDGDGDDDFSSDDSSDSLPDTNSRRHTVLRDVRLVTRSTVVLQYMQRLWRPARLTVGLLEPGTMDVARHCGCVTARIVRQKPGRHRHPSCYIYGSTASKTDLDVMRAMCEVDVDPAVFPAVYSWLSLVTGTEQERRNSWPSPAKLRHQHRLSVLQKSVQSGSPIPISPLVQGGTVTSTPVSRRSHHAERSGPGRLSPDPPVSQGTPRAWLFKSPT